MRGSSAHGARLYAMTTTAIRPGVSKESSSPAALTEAGSGTCSVTRSGSGPAACFQSRTGAGGCSRAADGASASSGGVVAWLRARRLLGVLL